MSVSHYIKGLDAAQVSGKQQLDSVAFELPRASRMAKINFRHLLIGL